MDGILVIHKPPGLTSHDVILRVRKLLGIRKIGHTGTLDPLVEGVLPLCIGRATKLVEYLQEQPKTYIAEWTAGFATDTEDQSGNIIESIPQVNLDRNEVVRVFQSFIGTYSQTPPMYSAVKVGGKRLYDIARSGMEIERPSREVTIYALDILEMNLELPHPKVRFRVKCSKGTYIRTLCVDLGRALSVPAHMSHLIRTESGSFTLEDAHTLEEITIAMENHSLEQIITPMEEALPFFPELIVPKPMVSRILNGQPIYPRFPLPKLKTGTRVRIVSPNQRLLAIHQVINKDEVWSKPEKILSV